jgi:hypothetical protein
MNEELLNDSLAYDTTFEEEKASYIALIDYLTGFLVTENTYKSIDKDSIEL